LAVSFAGKRCRVVENEATPRLESNAKGPWWTTVNPGVVLALAAEGHVTVARLRSTTLSARHQVGNRWTMQLQATVATALHR
jgi:hypothetical protein